MPGLGQTTARLAQMRKGLQRPSAQGDDAGMREIRGFGFNPGQLRMLAYAPENLPEGAPLVVVLHGCTQRAGAFASAAGWLTLADRYGFAVLAPEQDSQNNPNRCFNWFEPGDTARGAGEAASIRAMVGHLVSTLELDPERVFVTGLSAGGAMTAALLATYPDVFAAGAVVAGLPFGVAANVQEAFGAMRGGSRLTGADLAARVARAAPASDRRPRLAIWHGEGDGTVAASNAQALARQWASHLGLADRPDEVAARGGWARSTWRDQSGQAQIEMNLIAGLGHGTPLAAGGEDPIGQVAPFMLEAGVSSSLEIARFWGLAPADESEAWTPQTAAAAASAPNGSLGQDVMATVSPYVSDDVRQVISKALGAAGLMK